LECFIAQSTESDAHAVHLGIGRGQEVDIRRMDSFASIVDAWESLCQARKVLQKLKYHHNQDNNQITDNFLGLKHDSFGVLSNDDAMYSISGDINAARKWTSQGKRPGIDELPPGVHIKVLNPPVQKKYKVLLVKMKGELIKSSCGNPEATCCFSVGKSHAEPGGVTKRFRR
jgi:hypothetical protein